MKNNIKKIGVIIISLILCLSFASCGLFSTPKKSVDAYFKAMKAKDLKTQQEYVTGEEVKKPEVIKKDNKSKDANKDDNKDGKKDDKFEKEMSEILSEKMLDFDYEIKEQKKQGKTATVTVDITSYSMGHMFTQWYLEMMPKLFQMIFSEESLKDDSAYQEKVDKMMSDSLKEKVKVMKKDYKKTVTFKMIKEKGKWKLEKPSENKDFMDAITGGLEKSMSEVEKTTN